MDKLLVHPTSTAQWHALVHEAELTSSLVLDEELESYLVFLLMRFAEKPEMVASVLALEFLQGVQEIGSVRSDKLRDVGDKCLLFSGLFPGIAQRRRVDIDYFVGLGQNAYSVLAGLSANELAKLYDHLCYHFEPMKDVLVAMRQQQPSEAGEIATLFDDLEAGEIQIIGNRPLH